MSAVLGAVNPRVDLSSGGLPIDDAIVRWATDKEAAVELEKLRAHLGADATYLRIGYHGYGMIDDRYAEFFETKNGKRGLELLRRLMRDFVARLRSGDVLARGTHEEKTSEEWIPPKFWDDARPDILSLFIAGRVSFGVGSYCYVSFFDPSARGEDNVVAAVPVSRSGKSKGTAPATLLAVAAIAAVIYDDSSFPRRAAPLAKRAANKAQELSLEGADVLNPNGSSMRDIASAFLRGIEKVDAADTR